MMRASTRCMLLPCMCSHVGSNIIKLWKSRSTFFTSVWFLLGVDPHVSGESTLLSKPCTTLCTDVRLSTCWVSWPGTLVLILFIRFYVLSETLFLSEPDNRTSYHYIRTCLVRLLFCVNDLPHSLKLIECMSHLYELWCDYLSHLHWWRWKLIVIVFISEGD